MGEPLYGYQAPTGYSDAAETWVNGGLLERMNFGIALAGNRIAGTKVDLAPIVKENPDKKKLVDESLKLILARRVCRNQRDVAEAGGPVRSDHESSGLDTGTPEFQRQ